jgi:hypothetical protein
VESPIGKRDAVISEVSNYVLGAKYSPQYQALFLLYLYLSSCSSFLADSQDRVMGEEEKNTTSVVGGEPVIQPTPSQIENDSPQKPTKL